MGTSSWEHLSHSVEVLRQIAPRSVLDIGVGFGRWGILCREFLDVWEGRVLPATWTARIDGIEAFEANVLAHQRGLYDTIHIGDARDVLPRLDDRYDLGILGDVLEHFERPDAERILADLTSRCRYVLLVVPLGAHWEQEELYGNPYERHLSAWTDDDVRVTLPVAHGREFRDYLGRPYGFYVIARCELDRLAFARRRRSDVVGLAEAELAATRTFAASEPDPERAAALLAPATVAAVAECPDGQRRTVVFRALGPAPGGQGGEVWLFKVGTDLLPLLDPRAGAARDVSWREDRRGATGEVAILLGEGSALELDVAGDELALEVLSHPWSGRLEVVVDGTSAAVHDLDRPGERIISLRVPLC